MGYNYIIPIIGLGAMGIGLLLKNAKRAAAARSASTGFDNYRAKVFMGPFQSDMTTREAGLILGLREKATKEKILSAHKRLMLLNHPDNGGSTFIATKVNQAKDHLLDRLDS